MTKLTIGIGEDFPVEENAGEGCRGRRSHHHHHRGNDLHARWHRWWHERFRRSEAPGDTDKHDKDKSEKEQG